MKKMIVLLALSLVMLFSLVSCDGETTTPDGTGSAADASTSARLSYYEALVEELNAELLLLRQELYLQGLSYEARISDLEAALQKNETNNTPTFNENGSAGVDDTQFSYTLRGGEATLTGYTGTETEITIPATLGGCPVVAIGERAFAGNSVLRSVELPESLRSVGWFAFSGCVSLSSVTVYDAVESIAYGAFDNCNRSLTLHCSDGSYAQKYAHSYGLGVAN